MWQEGFRGLNVRWEFSQTPQQSYILFQFTDMDIGSSSNLKLTENLWSRYVCIHNIYRYCYIMTELPGGDTSSTDIAILVQRAGDDREQRDNETGYTGMHVLATVDNVYSLNDLNWAVVISSFGNVNMNRICLKKKKFGDLCVSSKLNKDEAYPFSWHLLSRTQNVPCYLSECHVNYKCLCCPIPAFVNWDRMKSFHVRSRIHLLGLNGTIHTCHFQSCLHSELLHAMKEITLQHIADMPGKWLMKSKSTRVWNTLLEDTCNNCLC